MTAIAALLGSSTSCVKFASEFDTDASSSARPSLGVGPGDWSCLAPDRAAEPVPFASRNVTYSFAMQDFVTGLPVREVGVRACLAGDLGCVGPVTDPRASGADGSVDVTLPQGFDGYLEIAGAGMIPTMMFFAAPWSDELLSSLALNPVRVFSATTVQANGDLAPAFLDANTGGIGVMTEDCANVPTAGVRIDIDSDGVAVALLDGLPVRQDVTSGDGLVGFGQVPPGVVVLSEFLPGQSEPIAVKSVLVRAGWSTILTFIAGMSAESQ